MMIDNSLLATILMLSSFLALAHGEDRPGPNGGFIRMPGAYHTEVVSFGKNKLKVFLLDVHIKNPTVRNSNIEITFDGPNSKGSKAKCEKDAQAFICSFDKTVDLRAKGTLSVSSTREDQTGTPVTYDTPMKHY